MKLPTDTNGLIFPHSPAWWHGWYSQRARMSLNEAITAGQPSWRRFWLAQARIAGADARWELDRLRRG